MSVAWFYFVRILRETDKAHWILLRNGTAVWIPKSQTVEIESEGEHPFAGIREWLGEARDELREFLLKERPNVKQRPTKATAHWRIVLGYANDEVVTVDKLKERYRALSMIFHPDKGGSDQAMQRLNQARAEAEREAK